jgi:hypothetical protein
MNWIKPFVVAFLAWFAVSSVNAQVKPRTERDLLGEKQVPANAYYGVQLFTRRILGWALSISLEGWTGLIRTSPGRRFLRTMNRPQLEAM